MFCYLYRFHNCLLKGNTLVVKRNWHFYRNLENWKGFWKLLEYLIQQSAIDNRYLNEKKIFTMNHANTKCYNVFEQSIRPLPWIWYENVCTYMNVLCNDILLYKTVLIMSCFMLLKKYQIYPRNTNSWWKTLRETDHRVEISIHPLIYKNMISVFLNI